jgi:hypothetical protein
MESDYFIIDVDGKKINYDCLERDSIIKNERKKVINFMKETLNGNCCIMIIKDEYTDEKYHIIRWSDNNIFHSICRIDPTENNIDKIIIIIN